MNIVRMLAGAACTFLMLAPAVGQSQSWDGHDRRVVIANDTSSTMVGFYATNVRRTGWGRQILRRHIPPGYEMTINIDDGRGYCRFDFKAVFRDGSQKVEADVNVCEAGRWRVYE